MAVPMRAVELVVVRACSVVLCLRSSRYNSELQQQALSSSDALGSIDLRRSVVPLRCDRVEIWRLLLCVVLYCIVL